MCQRVSTGARTPPHSGMPARRVSEIPHSADVVVMIPADDARMSWASLMAVVLLSWLGVALVTGTIIGHGIAFGTGNNSE